jgi:O-antigen/teichoic acid export membrane protein
MSSAANVTGADGAAVGHAQRSAATVFAIRVAGAGLAYGSQVLLARLMGKDAYGVFATAWVWILILGHVALFGLAQSACRFVPAYRVGGELPLARGFIATGAIATLASATLMALAGAVLLWLAQGTLNPVYVLPFAVALLVLPVFALQDYLEGVARSFNWMTLAIGPPFVIRPVLIALAMTAAVWLGVAAEAWVAVACTLLATSVATAIQAARLVPRVQAALQRGPRAYRRREWAAATMPIAFGDLTLMALGFVDVLLLGLFVSAGEVGIYFAATRIVQFVIFAQYAATAATAQRFSAMRAAGQHATLRALVRRTALLTSVATAGFGGALLLGAPVLLALFGPGFQASFNVLAILVAGAVLQSVFGPAEDLLNMLGFARTCAAVSFAAVVVAVVLCLVLIPPFGTIGAASAMAITLSLRAFALSVAARRRLGFWTHVLA